MTNVKNTKKRKIKTICELNISVVHIWPGQKKTNQQQEV